MPFVAMKKAPDGTAERIDITKLHEPKRDLAGADLVCQVCGAPMHVRGTLMVRSHFAHNPTSNRECPYSGGESLAHLAAKETLATILARRPEFAGARIDYEVPIRISPESRWPDRITDVFIDMGVSREAHEVQLAAITPAELEARTADYHAAGVDVYWWLGNRANTDENKYWCLEHIGGYGFLEFTTENRRVL